MATKETIYERDGGRCRYCGCRLEPWQATTDHVVPKKQGGRSTKDNTVTACPRCNAVKGDRSLEEAGMRLWSLEEFAALGGAQTSADTQMANAPTEGLNLGGAHPLSDTQKMRAPAQRGDGAQVSSDALGSNVPIPQVKRGSGAHIINDAHLWYAPIPPHFFDTWPYPQPDITVNEFDALYRDFKQYQKMRISRENYLRARTQLGLQVHPRLVESLLVYESLEKQAEGDLSLVKSDPLWPAFESLKGINVVLAAGIRGLFDPLAFPNVQKVWKFAGYAVLDGQGQRKAKGQKAGFCVPLKTRLWQAADCLWRANPEWRQIGRDYKAKQLRLHRHDGSLGKEGKGIRGHAHNRAMRFLAKRLIKYLWCYAHKAPMIG